jgi:hypothetical protein
MMHVRGSLGSPVGSPVFRPREAFQRLRDSSFLSGRSGVSYWDFILLLFLFFYFHGMGLLEISNKRGGGRSMSVVAGKG